MRVMMKVAMPVDAGNKAIKDGSLPKAITSLMDQTKPESAYFLLEGGQRTAIFFFDLKEPAWIPSVVEPLFMKMNAQIEVTPAMNAEDLRTGLERASKYF